MVILDVAVVNVALPSMRDGLHFSTAGLQWVVNAYTLTFAGFLMLGGRSADLLGRRRVFLVGVALFALSSLACAVADSRALLIAARALQGFGGAIVSPATLSIITSALPEGRRAQPRPGPGAAVGGLGASSGALLGGVLTQSLGWPAIFAINVPLGAVVIAVGLRALPADVRRVAAAALRRDRRGARHRRAGRLTFGIVRTDTLGWGSPGVLIPLAAAAALLAAFAYVEAACPARRWCRCGSSGCASCASRTCRGAPVSGAVLEFFFVTLYLQQALRQGALEAGLSFLPRTLSVFGGSSLAPRLVARFGLRPVLAGGMLLARPPAWGYLTGVKPGRQLRRRSCCPAAFLGGPRHGARRWSPRRSPRPRACRATRAGLASGLLNTSRLVGGALGLAVLGDAARALELARDSRRQRRSEAL